MKMKNMRFFSILFHVCCSCNNVAQPNNYSNLDTIKKPAFVSSKATLIRMGSEQEPRLEWAEIIGPLVYKGAVYNHIIGVRYFWGANKIDTTYYENLELRNNPEGIPQKVSFINREDGRIYFTEKDCYLFPKNKEDISKIAN